MNSLPTRDNKGDTDESDDEREGRKEKLSLNKKGVGSEARAALVANVDVDAQLLTPLEQQRQKFKQKKRIQGGRESAVCWLTRCKDAEVQLLSRLCCRLFIWVIPGCKPSTPYSVNEGE